MPRKRPSEKDWLPLGKRARAVPSGEGFRPEWIDFERGIRVGNLSPEQRITQIVKLELERRHRTGFVIDRWGRGEYWQWICWLPRANREAKPLSSDVNFGCAKLFISVDQEERVFKSGLQIERGYARGPSPYPGCLLRKDWDWHRLMAQCQGGSLLEEELQRLLQLEGFVVEMGGFEESAVFRGKELSSAWQLREAGKRAPAREWAAFQLYYPMSEAEVRACSGAELVRAVKGVLGQVVPAMNCCMQVPLEGSSADAGPASLGS